MGRHSCCVKQKLRKGLWSPEEDEKLYNYITRFGVGCWSSVPKLAGLQRCGKSCRLRWINYLRPDLKRGMFSQEEEDLILNLHEALGNRWAQIATQLPGRTDNEIKNFWNSCLKKKLIKQGIDPNTHKPITEAQLENHKDCLDSDTAQTQLPKALPIPQPSSQMENQAAYHLNNISVGKQVYDPLFLSEFQENPNNGYRSNFFLAYDHQSQSCGFNSMPNLMNFDQPNRDSKISASTTPFLISEEKESTFSWDGENKLENSVFLSGINQIDERKPSPWQLQNQSSDDYSNYSFTSLSQELNGGNLDVFHQI